MPLLNASDPADLRRARQHVVDGHLLAFPTETVYGLGARADDDAAVAAIFAAKGRPADHPLIVHVAGPDQAQHFAAEFSATARRLMQQCWPGPVSLVVRRASGAAQAAAGGLATIALRCPSHPVARELLAQAAALGVPGIAAPSANRFGRLSPTCAAHVRSEFDSSLWVLDGGACAEGIESAIVDCSGAQPALLRPGTLPRASLEAVLGLAVLAAAQTDSPRVPGALKAHYAPQAPLRLMSAALLDQALQVSGGGIPGLAVYSRSVSWRAAKRLARAMPDDPAQVARELFAVLREFDAGGAQLIWVEEPPADPAWDGVRDRLRRAAAA